MTLSTLDFFNRITNPFLYVLSYFFVTLAIIHLNKLVVKINLNSFWRNNVSVSYQRVVGNPSGHHQSFQL